MNPTRPVNAGPNNDRDEGRRTPRWPRIGCGGRMATALLAALALGHATADDAWKLPPEKTSLKPGAGREMVLGQCVACHSADYMTSQPPLDRAAWAASVEKMRSKYGAAIPTNAASAIADYLAAQYGPKAPAR
jgi:mono/diheme cytochrome c family protein